MVGKGENAGYQHVLLYPQCFQKPSASCVVELEFCNKGLKQLIPSPTMPQTLLENFSLFLQL